MLDSKEKAQLKTKPTRNYRLRYTSDKGFTVGSSKTKSSYLSQFITKKAVKSKPTKYPQMKKRKDCDRSMNNIQPKISVNLTLNDDKSGIKVEKLSDKVLQPPQRGRHRRTRSTITGDMISNTNFALPEPQSEPEKPVGVKKRPKIISSKLNKVSGKSKVGPTPFAPILEEDNYDNVIVNKSNEEAKEGASGPSYLDALKFASVYNKQADSQEKDDCMEDMIKKKMQKINDYRAKLKKKSVTFSRNIKKEHESMQKRVSSKTESGIAGSSTRESQS